MTGTALITGGAAGIGLGIARHLSDRGWTVHAADRDADALSRLPDGIAGHAADVSDEGQVAAVAARLGGRLDLLVNNAGLPGPEAGPVEDLPLSDWTRWLDTNLTGPFLVTKHCVPLLRAARGAIVNISSTRARMSEPDCEPYAATKGGIEALTHALAVSLGPDVRVNCIAPGWIVTGDVAGLSAEDHAQHPAGRAGRPEDVAQTVEWLAGAGFVTGQVITVDGGMTRKMIYAD